MKLRIRPVVDWLTAIAALWLLFHEGARIAEAISAEGVPSERGLLLVVAIAALIALRLLILALGSTVQALERDRAGTLSAV